MPYFLIKWRANNFQAFWKNTSNIINKQTNKQHKCDSLHDGVMLFIDLSSLLLFKVICPLPLLKDRASTVGVVKQYFLPHSWCYIQSLSPFLYWTLVVWETFMLGEGGRQGQFLTFTVPEGNQPQWALSREVSWSPSAKSSGHCHRHCGTVVAFLGVSWLSWWSSPCNALEMSANLPSIFHSNLNSCSSSRGQV